MAGHPVLGNRLPDRGVSGELTDGGPDARVVVEGAEADADRVRVARVVGVDVGAADPAEVFGAAALGLPGAQGVAGAGGDVERALDREAARRGAGARAPLAALAVAIG